MSPHLIFGKKSQNSRQFALTQTGLPAARAKIVCHDWPCHRSYCQRSVLSTFDLSLASRGEARKTHTSSWQDGFQKPQRCVFPKTGHEASEKCAKTTDWLWIGAEYSMDAIREAITANGRAFDPISSFHPGDDACVQENVCRRQPTSEIMPHSYPGL